MKFSNLNQGPTTMTYAMFSDTALHKFREFCDASNFSRPRNPAGAFDARPRYARDAAPEKDSLILSLLGVIDDMRPKGGANDQEPYVDVTEKLSALSELLKGTMQPDAFKEAEGMIIELIERCSELIKIAHEAENRSTATTGTDDEDQPPKCEGRPQRGGEPAMDSAAIDSFNALYPNAARIGHVAPYGEQPTRRHRPPSSAAIDSFDKMFPGVIKRIGNL